MLDQPKLLPMEPSEVFLDGSSMRPLVAGTVPRSGAIQSLAPPLGSAPPVTMELLRRGQERFMIFCSVCHGLDGYGEGMVVQRGFPRAASYHTERLRSAPDDYLFAVITSGYQNMPAYGAVVGVEDRWAIISYLRALQLSQNAQITDVPEETRGQLLE